MAWRVIAKALWNFDIKRLPGEPGIRLCSRLSHIRNVGKAQDPGEIQTDREEREVEPFHDLVPLLR